MEIGIVMDLQGQFLEIREADDTMFWENYHRGTNYSYYEVIGRVQTSDKEQYEKAKHVMICFVGALERETVEKEYVRIYLNGMNEMANK